EAEIAPEEVERRVAQTAAALGRELRVPGFRKGKVPPPVIISRVGREAVLDEAVRESLGAWYFDAIDASGIVPVGDPKLDLGDLPGEGEPLTFFIEVGVRPTAILGEYKGLEVARGEPAVAEETIDREVEEVRERLAKLEPVDRSAERGDFVVIDYEGKLDGEPFAGSEARDQLLELGSGQLVEGFEDQLEGAAAGEERIVRIAFPDDYRGEDLAGKEAVFVVTVKEVKRKDLPELDDDFAADAAGFDSLEELREDIRSRLEEAQRDQIEGDFRHAVLDAAAANAEIEVPRDLVHARAHELLGKLIRSLEPRGISKEAYLAISGKEEEELAAELEPDAEQALKREAVLAAVLEAEGISPTDEEVAEALEDSAEQEGVAPAQLVVQLGEAGRLEAVRADLAARRAMDMLVEGARPIAVEEVKASDKLRTPEEEGAQEGAGGQLWTPDSPEN
ncbi:MAG: trigger factor, partial [Solirubrobacteraceae bacterium]